MHGMVVPCLTLRCVVMGGRAVLGMRVVVMRIVIVLGMIVRGMIAALLRLIRRLVLRAVRSVTPMMIVLLRESEPRQRAEDRRGDERGSKVHARPSSTRTSRIMPASM
jgi:hypothetical protein